MGLYGYAIGDGIWATYTWDAENRLIRVEPGGTPAAGDKKVEFKYDYMGRRVEKRVYTWQYVTDHYDWVDSDCRRFVYYNWLPLIELTVTNPYSQGGAGGPPAETVTILRKYTWGLDLTGQNGAVGLASSRSNNLLDAAGGIGGLLACYNTNGTTGGENPTADDKKYIYFYDANGNVGQVIDWTNAAVSPPGTAWSAARMVATYEYDPYGNVTASAGGYADDNPFRFSTKYWDDETGLGYWGYRYYSASLGRWISIDPIEEDGNINLFRYTYNNPIDACDILGLFGIGPSLSQIYKHKACCKYVYTYMGEYTHRSQRTIDCPCVIHPFACCRCSHSDIRSGIAKYELLSAKKGPCCSCRVQLRRQTPYGWIRHISWITNVVSHKYANIM